MVNENNLMIFESMLESGSSAEKYWNLNIKKDILAMIDELESNEIRKNFLDTVIMENIELGARVNDLENELELTQKSYELEIKHGT